MLPKSIGCSKTFRGRSALTALTPVHKWLKAIGAPLSVLLRKCSHMQTIADCHVSTGFRLIPRKPGRH